MVVRKIDLNNKSIVDKISEALFFSALIIEILIVIIDKSAYINPIEGRLFQVTFALCMAKIALTKHNLKEWIAIVLLLAFGFLCYKITRRNDIIRFIAFVVASKGIDTRKALKTVLFVTLLGAVILVMLSLFGVLGTIYLETDYSRATGVEKRYCLGIGHPNALHCMFWALLSLGVWCYFDKIKWWHYLLFMCANLGLFILTKSRTGMLVSTMVICCGVFALVWPGIKTCKFLYWISGITLMTCVGFSIRVAHYNGFIQRGQYPVLDWLDSKLTGRLLDSGYNGNISKWSLLSDSNIKGYMDMGYIKLYHWYGIIPATLYILVVLLMIIRCYKKRDIASLILIMSFTIYTVAEAHAISPYFGRNYMIMLLIGTWSKYLGSLNDNEGYFWQVDKYLKHNS